MTLPTCKEPDNPSSFYFRLGYRTWFYGPFSSPEEMGTAMGMLDRKDPWWTYDSFVLLKGANPLPKDFAFGFPDLSEDERGRLDAKRAKVGEKK